VNFLQIKKIYLKYKINIAVQTFFLQLSKIEVLEASN